MCLRLLFFFNMLTFYHCVDFSGTTTKMQGLVFVTADTQHMARTAEPWRWLLLGLLLIAKAGTDILAEQSPVVSGFSSGMIVESGFCLRKQTQERLY